MKADKQRTIIIGILKENYVRGINSKYFYIKELYNYKERMRELRKQGWVFAKVKDAFNGHNFYRFWIGYNPFTHTVNPNVPKYATYWNDNGQLKAHEVKYMLTGQSSIETKSAPKYEYYMENGYQMCRVVGA